MVHHYTEDKSKVGFVKLVGFYLQWTLGYPNPFYPNIMPRLYEQRLPVMMSIPMTSCIISRHPHHHDMV